MIFHAHFEINGTQAILRLCYPSLHPMEARKEGGKRAAQRHVLWECASTHFATHVGQGRTPRRIVPATTARGQGPATAAAVVTKPSGDQWRSLLRIGCVSVAAAVRRLSTATSWPASFRPSGKPKMPPMFKDFERSPEAPQSSSTEGGKGQMSIPSSPASPEGNWRTVNKVYSFNIYIALLRCPSLTLMNSLT